MKGGQFDKALQNQSIFFYILQSDQVKNISYSILCYNILTYFHIVCFQPKEEFQSPYYGCLQKKDPFTFLHIFIMYTKYYG